MTKDCDDSLESQVSKARQTIFTDGYPMGIGELTNLYKDGELIIRPEFQRFFRWTDIQKSRLVESLLLGIPIPSIFVSQSSGGKWELIDGLQRVSTILELQGELKAPDGNLVAPLKLVSTKYIKALDGRSWDGPTPEESLSEAQRLDIKRAKLDIKIIKRDSSPEAKYDLFQRLNSYGSSLTAQEMRSALLVAVSSDFFSWLEGLGRHESFVQSVQLSERLVDERYDIELVLRFFALHNRREEALSLKELRDFSRVLDDESIELAESFPKCRDELEFVFKETFDFIAKNGCDDVFKRWDVKRQVFRGSFLNTSFEVFALGVGYHIANGAPYRQDLLETVKEFWGLPEMQARFATGRSTEARLRDFVPLGRRLLSAQ